MSNDTCDICPAYGDMSDAVFVVTVQAFEGEATLASCESCYESIEAPKSIVRRIGKPQGMSREVAIQQLDESFGPHAVLYPEHDDELGLRYLEGGIDPE